MENKINPDAERLWALNETGVDMCPCVQSKKADTRDISADSSAYPKPDYHGADMDGIVSQIAQSVKSEAQKAKYQYKYTPDTFERILDGVVGFWRDIARSLKVWIF